MRIDELLNRLSIQYVTEGEKHCRPGWINLECPYCTGNPGYHLGFHIDAEYFNCYRCGGHPVVETLSKLSNLSSSQVRSLIRQYGGKTRLAIKKDVIVRPRAFRFPSGTGPLQPNHIAYLQKRNFDPEMLERIWGLKGTGPIAELDKADYRLRIIIPIYWEGKIVSFQGRTISPNEPIRYKACLKVRERILHQHILYGKQEEWGDVGICVEGVTDVWRLGVKAFAVFGIDYTSWQIREIAKHFKKVIILFDEDPQAVKQARRLMRELHMNRIEAHRVSIKGDPADLSQAEADKLVKNLLG